MRKGIDYIGVAVVFICHDGEGNYLLHKRSQNCRDEHGRWDCGGGAIEVGDTAYETLVKEIEEEFCTEIIDYEVLGYRDVFREINGEKTHWVGLDFKVHINRSNVKNGEPRKFEKLGWFKLHEFPQPGHSQFPVFLEKYKDKL